MISPFLDFYIYYVDNCFPMAKQETNGEAAKPDVQQVKLPEPINPLGVRSVYANNLEVGASAVDVRLTFNEIIVDHGITVERRANIVTPVAHFGMMMQVLSQFSEKLRVQMKAAEEAAAKAATKAQTEKK